MEHGLTDTSRIIRVLHRVSFKLRHLRNAWQLVGVEVALHKLVLRHSMLGQEDMMEALEQAARHLRVPAIRIDNDTAVDGTSDLVDGHATPTTHGQLDDVAERRVKAVVEGDATMMPTIQRRAPARLLGRQFESRKHARLLGKQLLAKLEGILSRGIRDLIHEALGEERVLGVTHTTEEHDRHREVLLYPLDFEVGEVVADVLGALDTVEVDAALLHAVHEVGAGEQVLETRRAHRRQPDARTCKLVPPCDWIAVGIETSSHLRGISRTMEVMLHVLFTRPDQLDRLANLHGRLESLLEVVHLVAAAEAATEERLMHRDLVLGQTSDHLGHDVAGTRCLGRRPNLGRIATEVRQGVGRLQRRVAHIRHLVDRLKHSRSTRESTVNIAVCTAQLAFLAKTFVEGCRNLCRVQIGPLTAVELRIGRLHTLLGLPVGVGSDDQRWHVVLEEDGRSLGTHDDNVMDTVHGLGRGFIVALDAATEIRMADGTDNHAGHRDVHGIFGCAGNL